MLLGTVGDSAAAFPIGQGGIFNASSAGPLYLRINDDDACLGDNRGSVTMYISPVAQSPFGTYAGYTAVAGGKGAFGLAEATWVVPQISRTSCFPLLFSTPWVASWVGLWGSDDSIKNNTAWLPQIGTISACNTDAPGHRHAGRNYWAFWQMFTNVSGGGAQRHGNTPQAIQGMTIEPGDTMTGAVEYAGKSGSGLAFRLTLFDVTRTKPGSPDQFSITVTTTKPVGFKDIAAQAGAVVEPNCDTILGLAKFDTVPFTNVQAVPWNGTPEPAGVSLTKWTMTGHFGIKLAEPGTLFGFPGAMNYTVSYHASGPTAC